MNAKVVWQGGMGFLGTADTGFSVKMDSAEVVGGNDDGFRPTELLAIGIGGCTAMDVISILKKKRLDVKSFEVKLKVLRTEEHPKVFTYIGIEYVVTGKNINLADVERAVKLSEEKYCPSIAMFRQVAEISNKITIVEE